jgi:3-methyladenine DNA glycosylase Tag
MSLPPKRLARRPVDDNDYYRRMCRVILARLADDRWPAVTQALADFDLTTVAAYDEAKIHELQPLVAQHHSAKEAQALVHNARAMLEVAEMFGDMNLYLFAMRRRGIERQISDLSRRFARLPRPVAIKFLVACEEDVPAELTQP